jgi:hypothetical protein
MDVAPIDPVDTTWEERIPAYRVYFWTVSGDGFAPISEEWRLSGAADVHEVIAWAESERGGRTYELFVEQLTRRETPDGWVDAPGLVRLAGVNPVDDPRPRHIEFLQE